MPKRKKYKRFKKQSDIYKGRSIKVVIFDEFAKKVDLDAIKKAYKRLERDLERCGAFKRLRETQD